MMKPKDFETKHPEELTAQEISFIHLDTSYGAYTLEACRTRSMLSIIMEGIQMTMVNDRAKNLMPVMSLMSILDQLGICYNNTDKSETTLGNGIKRALYYFGDFDQSDDTIKVLYALRNGLLHNISLVSKNQFKADENYFFRYNTEIEEIYQPADELWNGDFSNLDLDKNVTLINPKNLKLLTDKCLERARQLNMENKLQIRLDGGLPELFYSYLRTIDR